MEYTHIIVLAVIVSYFVILFAISFWSNKTGTDNENFFIGKRQSSWYMVSIGMIGTTISGVTFVSVPGWAKTSDMTYMQMVFGYFVGYIVIVYLLLPIYYKLGVTTVYQYIQTRLGTYAYKTSASLFVVARLISSAAPFYLVAMILQVLVFSRFGVPFWLTVAGMIMLVWAYTYRSGLKTIIYTDVLQTICFILAIILIFYTISSKMGLSVASTTQYLWHSEHFRIFVFDDWGSTQNFFKQFFSGVFITIVMSGLDHNIMQKNLSCRNLGDAQKNMLVYGFSFIPINFILLCLGVVMLAFASQYGISLPNKTDQILPLIATEYLGFTTMIVFTVGIIAAALSSIDSALAAITTSVCIDLMDVKQKTIKQAKKIRLITHLLVNIAFIIVLVCINFFNSSSILHVVLKSASYTYGPLLGLFAFGIFTSWKIKDKFTPLIAIFSPLVCYGLEYALLQFYGYKVGYEILLVNGMITFFVLWLVRKGKCNEKENLKVIKR